MLPQLRPTWPFRPPTWRWQRAQRVISGEDSPPRAVESTRAIRDAIAFLRRLNRCADGDFGSLLEEFPTLYSAYALFTEPENELTRFELSARILAGQSVSELAKLLSFDRSVITTFETLFFDVRSRLGNRPFIINHVLGPAFHRGYQGSDLWMTWASAGYLHGPLMLEMQLRKTYGVVRPSNAAELREAMRDIRTKQVERKALLAAETIPVNSFTQLELLELQRRTEQEGAAAQAAAGGGGAAQPMEEAVAAVLTLLPVDIGKYVVPRIDSPVIRNYDDGAVQLSTRELLSAAAHPAAQVLNISAGAEWPSDLQYPEPTGNGDSNDTAGN